MSEKNLYLKLFHGRKDLKQDMDDWGVDGPIFELDCGYAHTTYAHMIHIGDYGQDLRVIGDCVYYGGMLYGDWSVFLSDEEGLKKEIGGGHWMETWDEKKATPPDTLRAWKIEDDLDEIRNLLTFFILDNDDDESVFEDYRCDEARSILGDTMESRLTEAVSIVQQQRQQMPSANGLHYLDAAEERLQALIDNLRRKA